MKEIIAIVCSDIHLNKWKELNPGQSRLKMGSSTLLEVSIIAKRKNVPILFTGDLFDNATWMHNEVFNEVMPLLKVIELNGIDIFAISGNHDMSERNSLSNLSPSWVKGLSHVFPNFHCIDNKVCDLYPKHLGKYINVCGIPYLNGNVDFKKCLKSLRVKIKENKRTCPGKYFNILMIHSDLPNAKEPDGREVGSVENISKNFQRTFRGFDLVLSGHIHKPQILKDKNGFKIYMLGSTNQQRMSDADCEMGYWIIYRNHEPKFVSLNDRIPTYKFYEKPEEKTNNTDYWIKLDKEAEQDDGPSTQTFSSSTGRDKLARRYCKITGIKSRKKRELLTNLLNSI